MVQVLGAGSQSCGQWVEERGTDSYAELVHTSWVTGYLTGYQDGGPVSLTDQQTSDNAARSAWLDNYCQANPLDNLLAATRGLWDELASR
jgi:hypothetical protein